MKFTAMQLAPAETYLLGTLAKRLFPAYSWVFSLVVWLVLLAVSCFIVFTRKNSQTIAAESVFSRRQCVLLALLFFWCVISLSRVSTFLYFNF
jgi:alginate O-acetyltransferase complex protein AlgI